MDTHISHSSSLGNGVDSKQARVEVISTESADLLDENRERAKLQGFQRLDPVFSASATTRTTHIKGVSGRLGNALDQLVGGVRAPLDVRAGSQDMLQDAEGQGLGGAGCR